MVYLRNKHDFETGLLLGQSLRFKVYKTNITTIFTHLLFKTLQKHKSTMII